MTMFSQKNWTAEQHEQFARLDSKLKAVLAAATHHLENSVQEPNHVEKELDDTIKKSYKVPAVLYLNLTEKEVWDITDGESDLISKLCSIDGVHSCSVFTPEETD